MMIDTLLFVFLISGLIVFLIYALLKGNKLSGKKFWLPLLLFLTAIISVFFYTGFKKINSDIARIIHNASPKSPDEIYGILFQKPLDSCVRIVNLKDQVIPKLDCCIWMEAQLCPAELKRIAGLRKYTAAIYNKSDSATFLQGLGDRPRWWSPGNLGDSLTKLTIRYSEENEQTIFFGADSSHVFICDQAL